jgi:hypothetical protein
MGRASARGRRNGVRAARSAARITLAELAGDVGVTRQTVVAVGAAGSRAQRAPWGIWTRRSPTRSVTATSGTRRPPWGSDLLRFRLLPYAALFMAYCIGVLRVAPFEGFYGGLVEGMVLGSACAAAWLLGSGLRARFRRSRSAD